MVVGSLECITLVNVASDSGQQLSNGSPEVLTKLLPRVCVLSIGSIEFKADMSEQDFCAHVFDYYFIHDVVQPKHRQTN